MQFALLNSVRVMPKPGAEAVCPTCKGEVIAKCGTINVWHWAHKANECDPWSEPESEWHQNWKALYPEDCREVVIGPHRADVRRDDGLVIEFQNSPISADEIREREAFYGKMIWVVNAESFEERFDITDKDYGFSFRWSHPRRSWFAATKPLYFDFGVAYCGLFLKIEKLYPGVARGELIEQDGDMWLSAGKPCAGWGKFASASDLFLKQRTLFGGGK